ncbi:MAG: Eco57I restriction-modification methylase domain-containing protein, partial [Proteobacteria bacterium]|nr:Eco57I restriction-modification methylase domain-containing protein [Pseudomonadota bacterium]
MSTEFLKKIQSLHHRICNDIIGHSADVPNRNAAASQKIRRWICRILILCFIRQKGFIQDEFREIISKAFNPNSLNPFLDSEAHTPETDAQLDIHCIPPQYLSELEQLLSQSVWTLDEDTDDPSAIHPGFLEKVFEILNERSNELGAYYTPPKIVRFMCRESLISSLQTDMTSQETESLRRFTETHDASCLTSQQFDVLKTRMPKITVCDPAAGSGAFLIGMFHELLAAQQVLEPDADPQNLKKHIILHQLHGTDIDSEALAIARWRLRLLLMADEKEPQTLCSRDFNLYAGNALINGQNGIDFEKIQPDGFDIVIGNPPYGIRLSGSERTQYKKIYPCLKCRFDIYMVFFMLGMKLTRNTLCYITPDKWLSKSFAQDFRQNCMIPNMTRILHLGNDIFDSALVDSVISIFQKPASQHLCILAADADHSCHIINEIDKSQIPSPFLIDQYFQSDIPPIIAQFESLPHRFEEYAHCEYACANPTAAYKIKPYIRDAQIPEPNEFRIINTGLIDPFTHRWGKKDMRYLKSSYPYPVTDADSIRL